MAVVLIVAGGLLGVVAAGLCDFRAGMAVAAVELVAAGVDMARDMPTTGRPSMERAGKELGTGLAAGPGPDE